MCSAPKMDKKIGKNGKMEMENGKWKKKMEMEKWKKKKVCNVDREKNPT